MLGPAKMLKDGQGWKSKAFNMGRVEERKRLGVVCAALFITFSCLLILNSGSKRPFGYFVDKCFELPPEPEHGLELGAAPEDIALPPLVEPWHNLPVKEGSNYTSKLSWELHLNGTSVSPCYHDTTNSTRLTGLPEKVEGKTVFRTDTRYRFNLVAYGMGGKRRCAGGDYYEVDLHDKANLRYRSRLPTVDFGNGSYGLELEVPSRFAGDFVLDIWLLFSNWHGMDLHPEKWVKQELMLTKRFKLLVPEEFEGILSGVGNLPENSETIMHSRKPTTKPTLCTQADFHRNTWQGRWTRSWYNESCEADGEKRFQCLPEEHFGCEEPWCFGPVGRLESNGWQYSAHCSFKIFEAKEAWKCLDGRWFLMWGDSNFQDTIRNMLLFVLDWELPRLANLAEFELERVYEAGFVNPKQVDEIFRVSQIFNGAVKPWNNGEGLNSLRAEEHQNSILAHFSGTRWPDTIIMNSGLHDGEQFKTIDSYAASADFVIEWWTRLYKSIQPDRRPQLIWRTTVAPAGKSRNMQSNPNKMEMYNQVMVEKLRLARDELPVKIIDTFDLTFPFHYNNDFSDGGHYGRAPGTRFNPWHGDPHWYFVDVMLDHIILNAVCPMT